MTYIIQGINPSVSLPIVDWRNDVRLATPELIAPENGEAVCPNVYTKIQGDDTDIILEWSAPDSATFSVVQICRNSSFSGPTFKAYKVTGETYNLLLIDDFSKGDTLYWRVASYDGDGGMSDTSETFSVVWDCGKNRSGTGGNTSGARPGEINDLCRIFDVSSVIQGPGTVLQCSTPEYALTVSWTCTNELGQELAELVDVTWQIVQQPNDGKIKSVVTEQDLDRAKLEVISKDPEQFVLQAEITFNSASFGEFKCYATKVIDSIPCNREEPGRQVQAPGGKVFVGPQDEFIDDGSLNADASSPGNSDRSDLVIDAVIVPDPVVASATEGCCGDIDIGETKAAILVGPVIQFDSYVTYPEDEYLDLDDPEDFKKQCNTRFPDGTPIIKNSEEARSHLTLGCGVRRDGRRIAIDLDNILGVEGYRKGLKRQEEEYCQIAVYYGYGLFLDNEQLAVDMSYVAYGLEGYGIQVIDGHTLNIDTDYFAGDGLVSTDNGLGLSADLGFGLDFDATTAIEVDYGHGLAPEDFIGGDSNKLAIYLEDFLGANLFITDGGRTLNAYSGGYDWYFGHGLRTVADTVEVNTNDLAGDKLKADNNGLLLAVDTPALVAQVSGDGLRPDDGLAAAMRAKMAGNTNPTPAYPALAVNIGKGLRFRNLPFDDEIDLDLEEIAGDALGVFEDQLYVDSYFLAGSGLYEENGLLVADLGYGLGFGPYGGIEAQLGDGLIFDDTNIAIYAGEALAFDSYGALSVQTGYGLYVTSDNYLSPYLGEGLFFDDYGKITVDFSGQFPGGTTQLEPDYFEWDWSESLLARIYLDGPGYVYDPYNADGGGQRYLRVIQGTPGSTLAWGDKYRFENEIPPILSYSGQDVFNVLRDDISDEFLVLGGWQNFGGGGPAVTAPDLASLNMPATIYEYSSQDFTPTNIGGEASSWDWAVFEGDDTGFESSDITSGDCTAVVILDDGRGIAAIGSNGSIYVTDDFGETWTFVEDLGNVVSGLCLNSSGEGVCTITAGGAEYTTDFGATWTSSSGIPVLDMYDCAINSDGQAVVVGLVNGTGGIAYSSNGGQTFTVSADYSMATFLSVDINDNDVVLVGESTGGTVGLVRSTNGGVNFSAVSGAALTGYRDISLSNSGRGVLGGLGGSGGIYYTDDAGLTLSMSNIFSNFWSPVINNDGLGLAEGTTPGGVGLGVYETVDYGETWAPTSDITGDYRSISLNGLGNGLLGSRENLGIIIATVFGLVNRGTTENITFTAPAAPATVTVNYTATNTAGSDTESDQRDVTSTLGPPDITDLNIPSTVTEGDDYDFTPTNIGGEATSWDWDVFEGIENLGSEFAFTSDAINAPPGTVAVDSTTLASVTRIGTAGVLSLTDVTDPSSPSLIGTEFTFATTVGDPDVAMLDTNTLAVAYRGSSGDGELILIDITTRTSPSVIGSAFVYRSSSSTTPSDITLIGTDTLVILSDDAVSVSTITIVDTTTRTAPSLIGTATTYSTGAQEGKLLQLDSTTVAITYRDLTFGVGGKLSIWDVTTLSAPTQIGSDFVFRSGTISFPYPVLVDSNTIAVVYAYNDNSSYGTLSLVDITTQTTPSLIGSDFVFKSDTVQYPAAILRGSDTLFVAYGDFNSSSAGTYNLIDISTLSSPSLMGEDTVFSPGILYPQLVYVDSTTLSITYRATSSTYGTLTMLDTTGTAVNSGTTENITFTAPSAPATITVQYKASNSAGSDTASEQKSVSSSVVAPIITDMNIPATITEDTSQDWTPTLSGGNPSTTTWSVDSQVGLAGDEIEFNSNSTSPLASVEISGTDYIAQFYKDDTLVDIYLKIVNIDTGSVVGTLLIGAGNSLNLDAVQLNSTTLLAAYRDNDDSNSGQCISINIATITSPAVLDTVEFTASVISEVSMTLYDTNKAAICYQDVTNSGNGTMARIDATDRENLSIIGTNHVFASTNCDQPKCVALDANTVVTTYQDDGDSLKGKFAITTAVSTTPATSTIEEYLSTAASSPNVVKYDSDTIILVYDGEGTGYGAVRPYDLTDRSDPTALSSAVSFSDYNVSQVKAVIFDDDYLAIPHRNADDDGDGTLTLMDISTITSISEEGSCVFNDGKTQLISACKSGSQISVAAYKDADELNVGSMALVDLPKTVAAGTSSNITFTAPNAGKVLDITYYVSNAAGSDQDSGEKTVTA